MQTIARPRFLNLDYELANSKFVGLVVVNNYDSLGNIKFLSVEYKDTTTFAYVAADATDRYLFSNPDLFLTASLPSKGDTVLIVLDSLGRVSLFAKETGNYYRFWSPWITGSLVLFSFLPPAIPIDKKNEIKKSSSENYNECWDGCLLLKNDLRLYISNSNNKQFGKIRAN